MPPTGNLKVYLRKLSRCRGLLVRLIKEEVPTYETVDLVLNTVASNQELQLQVLNNAPDVFERSSALEDGVSEALWSAPLGVEKGAEILRGKPAPGVSGIIIPSS